MSWKPMRIGLAGAILLGGCAPAVHSIRELDLRNAAYCAKVSEESCVSTFAGPMGANTGYARCKEELLSKGESRGASHIVWTSWGSNTVTTVTAQTFECRKVAGIGVRLGEQDGAIVVREIVADGPASQAGLPAGTALATIDGAPVSSMEPAKIVSNLRGVPGSQVRIGVVGGREYVLTRALLPWSQDVYDELLESARRQARASQATQGAFNSFVQQNQPDPDWARKHQEKVNRQNEQSRQLIDNVEERGRIRNALSQDESALRGASDRYEQRKALDAYQKDAVDLKRNTEEGEAIFKQ